MARENAIFPPLAPEGPNDLMQFLPNDNTLTDLQNDTDNLATYDGVLNLVNPNSRTNINSGTDYLTRRNQISDWIETAYATAVVNTHTDHLVTTGFCDVKYATTKALTTLQGPCYIKPTKSTNSCWNWCNCFRCI